MKNTNSIFEQDWWWDAVAPNAWKGIEVQNSQGEIIGRMPIMFSKKMGFRVVSMPPFTQTCGPWILVQDTKKTSRLQIEKDILGDIIEKFPKISNVDIILDTHRSYILPFRWHGFRYEPTFTYILENLKDTNQIYANFRKGLKSDIKKAERIVKVEESSDIEILIALQDKTFRRQGRKNPMPKDTLRRLHKACEEHKASKLLIAKDENNQIHAAAYFVYDQRRCYYLFGGADPILRSSGAGSLLLWEGIKFASTVSEIFDFEGSNVEDIERFFRSFGAKPIVNYRIYKLNLFLTIADYFKPKLKKIIGYRI